MAIEKDIAEAAPNKSFFVSMLTRDIELQDAILDLLDNCVDGVQRATQGKRDSWKRPYKGYYAKITMRPDLFRISDNCGGIPPGDAKNRAFMMGRPTEVSPGLATVGRYGIGMKRAIFKLGESASVFSKHADEAFRVDFTKEWMTSAQNWRLPMTRIGRRKVGRDGTRILITEVREEIAARFDPANDNFLKHFENYVSRHYSLIIEKGFEVYINGNLVQPSQFTLFARGENVTAPASTLDPYLFQTMVDGVRVEIYAGLFRRIPSDEELDKEGEAKMTREESGWTIACNDRVVLYRDRTHVTGWGTGGVPNWHGQFMAFSGLVILHSNDVSKLPLTTTKRGIDASSKLYAIVLDYMREATKLFTNFTNKWKKAGDELTTEVYNKTSLAGLGELRVMAMQAPNATLRKFGETVIANVQRPTLPMPKDANRNVRISFEKQRDEVAELAEYLFEDRDTKPGVVGERAFDRSLRSFRRKAV